MSQLSAPPEPASPSARRLRASRARDPRLWLGLLLVIVATVMGGRIVASADDTVGVWAAKHDIAGGAALTPEVLRVQQVRLGDGSAGDYLRADQPLPDGASAARDVAKGELLHRGVLDAVQQASLRELPVVVGASGAPDDLRSGEIVDVWVVPPADQLAAPSNAEQVLISVPVIRATRSSGPLGEGATRQVVLGLDEHGAARLAGVLAGVASGDVILIRHGG